MEETIPETSEDLPPEKPERQNLFKDTKDLFKQFQDDLAHNWGRERIPMNKLALGSYRYYHKDKRLVYLLKLSRELVKIGYTERSRLSDINKDSLIRYWESSHAKRKIG